VTRITLKKYGRCVRNWTTLLLPTRGEMRTVATDAFPDANVESRQVLFKS
jgi:hypothetical protein